MTQHDLLAQEWTTLQNNHEWHERSALLIKLVSVVLCAMAWAVELRPWLVGALVGMLWLQEAILKTWQARLADRLMLIEAAFQHTAPDSDAPFQLHSQWQAQRPGLAGLLADYSRSALRPTVAFPYVVLLGLVLAVA
ncbi:hypothetical protein HUU62_23305 [Rhodoferax sp. 4810]|nr:hypothetical protein [Rhodoferax jenense]